MKLLFQFDELIAYGVRAEIIKSGYQFASRAIMLIKEMHALGKYSRVSIGCNIKRARIIHSEMRKQKRFA